MLPEFQQRDTQVLGASTDAAAPQKAFADHCGITFPLVADFPTFAVAKAFGVFNEDRLANTRVSFVIDKQGIIQHVIEEPRDMLRHGNESLEVVKKLAAKK